MACYVIVANGSLLQISHVDGDVEINSSVAVFKLKHVLCILSIVKNLNISQLVKDNTLLLNFNLIFVGLKIKSWGWNWIGTYLKMDYAS